MRIYEYENADGRAVRRPAESQSAREHEGESREVGRRTARHVALARWIARSTPSKRLASVLGVGRPGVLGLACAETAVAFRYL